MDNAPEVAVGVVKAARASLSPDEPEALQCGGSQGFPPRRRRPCAAQATIQLGTHPRLGDFRRQRHVDVVFHVGV
eukprot:13632135-Alexandrium_andersonii.AAC.1